MAGNKHPIVDLGVGLEDNTKAGVESIKDGLASIPPAAQKAAGDTSAAIDKIGAAGDEAATSMDRASSSIASSLRRTVTDTQRQIANLQSSMAGTGGAGSADAFERIASFKGADPAVLKPLIDQVRVLRAELDSLRDTEQRAAGNEAFKAREQQANQLRRVTEQTQLFTKVLDDLDAKEAKTAANNAFVQSLQAQSAAIGKTKADLLEMEAVKRGVASEAAPYIASLREQERAAIAGGKALNQYGISAGQTKQALRQVPAQITDIVVSLQSGQKPLTVLLQQGGQLKDMFGGVVPAFKALAGAAAGMISATTLGIGAIAGLGVAYYQGSKEADAYNAALINTGNISGTTSARLQEMAASIAKTNGTQGAAAETLAALAGTGEVAARNLQAFGKAAVIAQTDLGLSLKEIAKNFEALGEDPVKASAKLNKELNYLTASTYDQISALKEQGKATEAAEVAQKAYASALESRSAQTRASLGYIERGWKAITAAAKGSWDAMLDVGRGKTAESKLGDLRTQLALAERDVREKLANSPNSDVSGANKGIEILKQRIGLAASDERQTTRLAQAEAERAKDTQASIKYRDFATSELLTKEEKGEKKIKEIREDGMARVRLGLMTTAELEKDIAKYREQQKEKKGGNGDREAVSQGKELADLKARIEATDKNTAALAAEGIAADKVTEGKTKARAIEEELAAATAKRMTASQRAHKEDLLAQYKLLDISQQKNANEKDRQKALEKDIELVNKATDAAFQEASNMEKTNKELKAQIDSRGRNATAIARETAELARQRFNEADSSDAFSPAYVEAQRRKMVQAEEILRNRQRLDAQDTGDKQREQLAYAKDQNDEARLETRLLGMSEEERRKIVAQQQISLRLAKELRAIEDMDLGNDEEGLAAKEKLRQGARQKAAIESNTVVVKDFNDQWFKNLDDFNSGMANALETAIFNGSKEGGKKMREVLQEALIKKPLRAIINATMNQLTGGVINLLLGGGGGGGGAAGGASSLGGVGNLLSAGQSAYGLYSGTGPLYSAYGAASAALGFNNAAAGAYLSHGAAGIAGSGTVSGIPAAGLPGLGAGNLGTLGSAGLVLAGLATVANIFGAFKTKTTIGSGLQGTLGGSDLTPWAEVRTGGSLISGPSFKTSDPLALEKEYRRRLQDLRDTGQGASKLAETYQTAIASMEASNKGLAETTRAQSKSIQDGYKVVRTGVVDMANVLGLAGSSVKDFTFNLAAQDLNFKDLTEEQITAKIGEAYGKATEEMAKQLIGSWKEATETNITTTSVNVGSQGEDASYVYTENTETTKKMVYEASVYAKAGEKAIDTLTRLSGSFSAVNYAADAMGLGLQTASLSAAAFASDIVEAFGGLDKFIATTNTFLNNFYSGDELRRAQANQGVIQLKNIGITTTAEQLLGLSRQDIKDTFSGWIKAGADSSQLAGAMNIVNGLNGLWPALDANTESVKDTTDAVDELTQSFNSARDSLRETGRNLAVQLLKAFGDEVGAAQLEKSNFMLQFANLDQSRQNELSALYDTNVALQKAIDVREEHNTLQDEYNTLTDTGAQALQRQRDALDSSNRALFDNVQALKLQKTTAEELTTLGARYLSPQRQLDVGYDKVATDLRAEGYSSVTGQALQTLNRDQLRALLTTVYNLGETSDTTRLALVRAGATLTDLEDKAAALAADGLEKAYASLEKATQSQLETLDKTVEGLKAVFDTLKTNVRDLYNEVGESRDALAREGNRFINEAYQTALTGGGLPDSEALTEAIDNVRSGIDKSQYASQYEADKARLLLAGKLSTLQDISGDALTEAEQQVQELKDSLVEQRKLVDLSRLQLDAQYVGNGATQSVAEALAALAVAMSNASTVSQPAKLGGGGGTSYLQGSNGAGFDENTGVGYQAGTGLPWLVADVKAAAEQALLAGQTQQVYDAIKSQGFTLAQANAIFDLPKGTAEEWAKAMGLPVYHSGIDSVPKTGLALLQQGERVTRAADNTYAAGRADARRADAMEAKLARIIELLQEGNASVDQVADLMNEVSEGGNAFRVDIMNNPSRPVPTKEVA